MLRSIIRLACAVALLAANFPNYASAQLADRRTLFTFSGPVAVPGVTLPAGQYLFRLADPDSSRRVVQVLSADGTRPYSMFFAIPAERVEASAQPEVRFMETPKGTPSAIQTWWYPGERTGFEFIYPKDQARKLAQGGREPVLTTHAETTTAQQTNTAGLARVSSTGQETDVNVDAKPTAAAPTGATHEGTVASSSLVISEPSVPPVVASSGQSGDPAVASAGNTGAPQTTTTRTRLPQTASLTPMVAAIGTLALAAAITLWAWRTGRLPHLRR